MGGFSKLGSLFGVLNLIRHLLFRVPKWGTIIWTTTHVYAGFRRRLVEPEVQGQWLTGLTVFKLNRWQGVGLQKVR